MRTTVNSVMTRDVAAVPPAAPVKDLTELLVARRVSAVPVVDTGRHVIGVVSEADVLRKEEFRDQYYREEYRPPLRTRLRHLVTGHGRPSRKARGHTAGDVMTAPAVTVRPTTSVVRAARLMDEHDVKRLPVVDDDGRLVGIVSRGDLLKVFSRPDADIAAEVENDVLGKYMLTSTGGVRVHVDHGVVHLRGAIGRRSEARIVTRVTGRVNGVVDVVDEMTWTDDDEREWRGA
ncbi:CBS domain-containing protein [Sphaerisporangium rubeum]|uniref:CBS domain-containing protein n=1 Tax=Sphaerisporangium rubeum TaxID=321317 RepID=A0A7X0IBA7_9ACTN|nr:CBS domain-containing protein [Sphaerisporangium rubeum]MBB6470788.1 CBS domain-containing protein [Sphaerisporangium rubeum]